VVWGGGKRCKSMNLDKPLTLDECARWLRLRPRDVAAKARGLRPKIPAIRLGRKTLRFHPRTILAKFAADAGVPLAVVQASFSAPKSSTKG